MTSIESMVFLHSSILTIFQVHLLKDDVYISQFNIFMHNIFIII